MADVILDGAGKQYRMKVSSEQRAYVDSVQRGKDAQANRIGDAYNLNTGIITLTNATETPVMYVKNNEEKDLVIEAIAVGLGDSTGGDNAIQQITIIRNPTTGTIIDTPVNIDINSNRNYGSKNTLTADAYKGATNKTMTNGENHILFYQTDKGRLFAAIEERLPKGSSIGVKIAPQTGNTSQNVYCALICHLEGDV